MSYIVLIRNPNSGALFAMVEDGRTNEQVVKEWPTHKAAVKAMKNHIAGEAWSWGVFQVALNYGHAGTDNGGTKQ